ncbi:MAG: hypothetical protein ACRENE_05505, partial [Polyangiaceae bacterium]
SRAPARFQNEEGRPQVIAVATGKRNLNIAIIWYHRWSDDVISVASEAHRAWPESKSFTPQEWVEVLDRLQRERDAAAVARETCPCRRCRGAAKSVRRELPSRVRLRGGASRRALTATA